MAGHRKDEAAICRGQACGRVSRQSVVVSIGLLALVLVGCGLFRTHTTGPVINLCAGLDASVDVYGNDEYRGTVDYPDSVAGVAPGLVRLRAVGTGEGGEGTAPMRAPAVGAVHTHGFIG